MFLKLFNSRVGFFDSYGEALEVFEFCGGIGYDVHRLDRDKDGLPCEGLM